MPMDVSSLDSGKKRVLPANSGSRVGRENKRRRHSRQATRTDSGRQELSQISANFPQTESQATSQETSSLPMVIDLSIRDNILEIPNQPSRLNEISQQDSHKNGTSEDETSNISQASGLIGTTAAADADVAMLDIGVAIQPVLVNCVNGAEREIPFKDEEVCFGLLEMAAKVKRGQMSPSARWLPIAVEPVERSLAILDTVSQQLAGIAGGREASVICRIAKRYRLRFTGHVENRPVAKTNDYKYVPTELRLVLYGYLSEKDDVAKRLSDDELFLQNPAADECEVGIPYHNPHYLVRPGGRMPALEDGIFSLHSRVRRSDQNVILDDLEKGRLLQLFETGLDPKAAYGRRPSDRLRSALKPHQISALSMMVEKEVGANDETAMFPGIWKRERNIEGREVFRHTVAGSGRMIAPPPAYGGILADDMGLGKTLSAIALICWHLDSTESSEESKKGRRPTLVVTPKSLISEWEEQLERHVRPGQIKYEKYHGNKRTEVAQRWFGQDIILTTYDTVRIEDGTSGRLFGTTWDRIILDEAHNIRNSDSKLFRAVKKLRGHCRWCLTGTPIQNSLDDFGSLLAFIGTPAFEHTSGFTRMITDAVNSKKPKATERLRRLVEATCLRRTKKSAGLGLNLPNKTVIEELVELGPQDRGMYEFFKQRATTAALELEELKMQGSPRKNGKAAGAGWGGRNWFAILPLIHNLRRICDHGEDMLSEKTLQKWRERDVDWQDWSLKEILAAQKCASCNADLSGAADAATPFIDFGCGHLICGRCLANENVGLEASGSPATQACPICTSAVRSPMPTPTPSQAERPPSVEPPRYTPSPKVKALLRNLRQERRCEPPAKSIIFSYWTTMLDLIEKALRQEGIKFGRIDGKRSIAGRASAVKALRDDPECRVLLASITSAGEGLNLTAACRVHLMEPHWNPMAEEQAIDRVHRITQQRDVVVTRYMIKDSIEWFVRDVQDIKYNLVAQSLSAAEHAPSDLAEQGVKKLLEYLK